jgi:hypothetical protein
MEKGEKMKDKVKKYIEVCSIVWAIAAVIWITFCLMFGNPIIEPNLLIKISEVLMSVFFLPILFRIAVERATK